MFSRYIVLILFFFCWSSGSAQLLTDKLFFEHLTTEDGLSHNYVQSIYQDKDGFIWLGSDNGLNRYDGQRIDFLVLIPNPLLEVIKYAASFRTGTRIYGYCMKMVWTG